jgi:hypothetical protein
MPTAIGNDYTAILSGESGHFNSPLAQFGLTPKSKRGLAASDPGEVVRCSWMLCGTGRGYTKSDIARLHSENENL